MKHFEIGDRVLLHGVWGTVRIPCDDALCTRAHYNNWTVPVEIDVPMIGEDGEPTGETVRQLADSNPRYHYENRAHEARAGIIEAAEAGGRYAVRLGEGPPTGEIEGTVSADAADLEVAS